MVNQRFLQLVQTQEKNGYDSYFEAALDMRWSVLSLVAKLSQPIAANRDEIVPSVEHDCE